MEWFVENDRENRNTVRSVWNVPELEVDSFSVWEFPAGSGFAQGAPDSPLRFIVFMDLVICQLAKEGVGQSVKLPTHGFDCASPGLTVFADDTTILERTLLVQLRQSIVITEAVFDLAMLQIAGKKSVHTALRHNEPAMRAATLPIPAASEIHVYHRASSRGTSSRASA